MLSPDQITHATDEQLQVLRPVIDVPSLEKVSNEGWQLHGSTLERPFDHYIQHDGAELGRFDVLARPTKGWLEDSPEARERFGKLALLAGPIGHVGVSKYRPEQIAEQVAIRNSTIADVEQSYGPISLGLKRGSQLLLTRLLAFAPNEQDAGPVHFKHGSDLLPMTASGIYIPLQKWPRNWIDKK